MRERCDQTEAMLRTLTGRSPGRIWPLAARI